MYISDIIDIYIQKETKLEFEHLEMAVEWISIEQFFELAEDLDFGEGHQQKLHSARRETEHGDMMQWSYDLGAGCRGGGDTEYLSNKVKLKK